MTEYRKSGDKTGGAYYAISNQAGNDDWGQPVRPYAEVVAYKDPSKFIIPYPNDSKNNNADIDGVTGLSSDYIQETRRKLVAKGEDNWDGHDDSFMDITNHLASPFNSSREIGAEHYKEVMGQWGNRHFQPDKLFEYKPSAMEIDTLHSDPSMRASAMNLIAVAKRDLGAEIIKAPESLSRHSSRLVKKAQKLGFPVETHPDNPGADVSNTIGFHEQTIAESDLEGLGEVVPSETIAGAKQDLREMLSNRRQRANNPRSRHNPKRRNTAPVTRKGLSDQFLPGMEDFV